MNLDNYGGWKEKSFHATGFFRLEKTDKRWWLVTPEGHAFLSHGVNHVELKWMQKFYNLDYWAHHYKVLNNFANEYLAGYIDKVKKDIAYTGWNTLGCHSPQSYYNGSFIPYVQPLRFVDIHHYEFHDEKDFPDVFSIEFEKYCDEKARQIAKPRKDDPFLLGYNMTDCPVLTDLDAEAHPPNIYGWDRPEQFPTWPRVLSTLGEGGPGKKVYVDTVQELHADNIESFNQTYGTTFKSFDELLRAKNWRLLTDSDNKQETRDNMAFLIKVVDKCYEIEVAAIKKYDSNHLIFGDKLNGNTDTPAVIIALAGKHFDVIFFQYYALWEDLRPWLDKCASAGKKPLFHGDASCSVPCETMPSPFGPHCRDQIDRVEQFKKLYYNAFARPDFVAWNWCGWMDSWECGGQIGKQHSGMQDPFGNYHPVAHAIAEFGKEMYSLADKARF